MKYVKFIVNRIGNVPPYVETRDADGGVGRKRQVQIQLIKDESIEEVFSDDGKSGKKHTSHKSESQLPDGTIRTHFPNSVLLLEFRIIVLFLNENLFPPFPRL